MNVPMPGNIRQERPTGLTRGSQQGYTPALKFEQRSVAVWLQGWAYILLVCIIWIGSSYLVSFLEQGKSHDQKIEPFVLTMIGNVCFIVCILERCGKGSWSSAKGIAAGNAPYQSTQTHETDGESPRAYPDAQSPKLLGHTNQRTSGDYIDTATTLLYGVSHPSSTGRDTRTLFVPANRVRKQHWISQLFGWEPGYLQAGLVLGPLYFTAQWTYNVSLNYTSVSTNTILSATAPLVTLIASMLTLGEGLTLRKGLAIVACIGGVTLVTLSDGPASDADHNNTILGDILAIVSVCFYSLYTAMIKASFPAEDSINTLQLYGVVGVVLVVLAAPAMAIYLGAGLGTLQGVTPLTVGLLVLKGLIANAVGNILWTKAVFLVGPTVTTIGLNLQIPATIVIDILLAEAISKRPAWMMSALTVSGTCIGAALVSSGICLVVLTSWGPSWLDASWRLHKVMALADES